jgi:hypothetical protein
MVLPGHWYIIYLQIFYPAKPLLWWVLENRMLRKIFGSKRDEVTEVEKTT